MGVAKKRSAGAVQQNRGGLIGVSFDVTHVVKEERRLERPGDSNPAATPSAPHHVTSYKAARHRGQAPPAASAPRSVAYLAMAAATLVRAAAHARFE